MRCGPQALKAHGTAASSVKTASGGDWGPTSTVRPEVAGFVWRRAKASIDRIRAGAAARRGHDHRHRHGHDERREADPEKPAEELHGVKTPP